MNGSLIAVTDMASTVTTVVNFLGDRSWKRSPYAVRPLSVLSVTLVYCGQTIGQIKVKLLGTKVDLGPDHIVLDGNPGPLPQRGTAPNFRPSVVAKSLDGLRCHLVRR